MEYCLFMCDAEAAAFVVPLILAYILIPTRWLTFGMGVFMGFVAIFNENMGVCVFAWVLGFISLFVPDIDMGAPPIIFPLAYLEELASAK